MPSLNERKEDIPLLVRHMLVSQAQEDDLDILRFFDQGQPRVHPLLIEQLVRHIYTTNVSEVGFLLGHAMAESHDGVICPVRGALPSQARSRIHAVPSEQQRHRRAAVPLPSTQQAQRALDENQGHIARAACDLGISRHQLDRMIQRNGLVVRRPKKQRSAPGSQ